jgi:glycosyltransferase involved in cell wall biosynthesis
MKILFVHEIFPPEFSGGGEMLVYRLARGLKDNGHDVTILCSGNPSMKEYDGIRTIRISVDRYMMNLSLPWILKYAKDYDVIQTTSGNCAIPSWLASKILNKPVCMLILHAFGDYWSDVRGPIVGRVFQSVERFYISRYYDALVVMNNNIKNMLKKIGTKTKNIVLLQPGLEDSFSISCRKKTQVLFVGNFSMDDSTVKLKGLDRIVEVAINVPEIDFIVLGDGSGLDKIKKISPKNVKYLGIHRGNALKRVFSESLIFCLPSLSEGFSFVTAEAMRNGCAVISSTDLGQKGTIIKSNDIDKISSLIRGYIKTPKNAIKEGHFNEKISKNFSYDKMISGFETVYNKIIF